MLKYKPILSIIYPCLVLFIPLFYLLHVEVDHFHDKIIIPADEIQMLENGNVKFSANPVINATYNIAVYSKTDSVSLFRKLHAGVQDIEIPFTNQALAKSLKTSVSLARKISYCLRKMEILKIVGKNGNALLFSFNRD